MKVIFFDGKCGLCNGFVDFMIKVDDKGIFKFSPLQSEYAKAHLDPSDVEELKSVVLQMGDNTYRKSEAVLKTFKELGGVWKAATIFNYVPRNVLNKGYDLVSEHRYRIFGKRDTCRLPTPEEKARFIL